MISVRNLVYRYPGAQRNTLDGLTFDVSPGEVFGLLGPSGSGKSTTQRILLGTAPGYTGSAELFGNQVSGMGRHVYERIGVGFELPACYLRLTALENLRLFASLYTVATRDPEELLALVELDGAKHQRVAEFSKGMKLRLNLCRALINDPELLFLDEPTSGQDPRRAQLIRRLVRALGDRGKAVFLTTHNMTDAREVCDRVAFLIGGNIAAQGAPNELAQRYGTPTLEVVTRGDEGLATHHFDLREIASTSALLTLTRGRAIVSMHTQEASLDDVFVRLASDAAGGALSAGGSSCPRD